MPNRHPPIPHSNCAAAMAGAAAAGLMLSRAAVGLGEGVAPSSATDIAARCVETSERSRAISFIFGGLHVGTLLGLLIAPYIIEHFGWPAVFYLFGVVGT
jgi:ACS family sodium-dependent inorganic phosphate cotransporter